MRLIRINENNQYLTIMVDASTVQTPKGEESGLVLWGGNTSEAQRQYFRSRLTILLSAGYDHYLTSLDVGGEEIYVIFMCSL